MKKRNISILLTMLSAILFISLLAGCNTKTNTDKVKSDLQGRWVYGWYAEAIQTNCYSFYDFTESGVTYLLIHDNDNGIVLEKHGKYEIEESSILITFEDDRQERFEYSYSDDAMSLINRGDGTSEKNYVKMDDE